jgi:hypothetical protein
MTTIYRAGQDTDAFCGKCGMMLAHVIHAVAATGRPARVECKTCNAIHGYRPAPPGSKSATTKKRATGGRQTPEKLFNAAIDGVDVSSPTRYTIKDEFEKNMVIDHKKFGLGLVTQSLADNKIEVIFIEGTKILIHRR